MDTALFFLRGLLLVVLVLSLLYYLVPSFETALNERIAVFKDKADKVANFVKDNHYNVPVEHRKPLLKMKDFYKQQNKILQKQLIDSRLTFQQQNHLGTNLTDGYNALLPEGYKWQNGMIILDEIGYHAAKASPAA